MFESPSEVLICIDAPDPSAVDAAYEPEEGLLGVHLARRGDDWYGSVHLPALADPSAATATFADGVLAIRIPKRDDEDDALRPPPVPN